MDIPDYGFIILRHVRDELTNKYWQLSYDSIRNVYPDVKVVIIDDNSDKKYLTHKEITNAEVIDGEYPGRGELLPYIYYLRHRFFKKAVIIHDSVFVNKRLDIDSVKSYGPLLRFKHTWNDDAKIKKKLAIFNRQDVIDFYDTKRWRGAFGAMCIVTHEALSSFNEHFHLQKFIPIITCREDRMDWERIFACLMYFIRKASNVDVYGDVHKYCPWGLPFHNRHLTAHLPFTKVWTGR